ncbi:hypothetical protein [Cryobacterium sp. CG_9.6]|uniref:hypothetical protein n=1 Tax=Cryobacterium sp. CG_9.6 TaxID=2760710 RepID=UPI002475D2B2|nr:hypothetical protein [Cryobacterium sp. CG_9.6]MDH6236741.1 hypothetical protein [Cryobacterium sp. CG_9.6]
MDQQETLDAVLDWVSAGGPPRIDAPLTAIPAELDSAVLGIGTPIRTHRPTC